MESWQKSNLGDFQYQQDLPFQGSMGMKQQQVFLLSVKALSPCHLAFGNHVVPWKTGVWPVPKPLVWVSAPATLTFQGIFQGSQGAALVFVNKVLADAVLWPFGDWKFRSLRLQLGSRVAAEMSTAQSVVHGGVTPVQHKEEALQLLNQPGLALPFLRCGLRGVTLPACVTLGFLICEMVLF